MRYLAAAFDYDGTLATQGQVEHPVVAALEELVASGRKLVMVTGRELDDLLAVFPQAKIFDRIVAENGALLYRPATQEEIILTPPADLVFVEELKRRDVTPLSVGRGIVATWHPNETTVLQTIRDLGLELQVIFNKGAVMVLPSGVNKGTGLKAALDELGLSPHNVVGVGDAENDHAFLSMCEVSVAVQNALPAIKERVDMVTQRERGSGIVELVRELLANDLVNLKPSRHRLELGTDEEGKTVLCEPYGTGVLIAGTSGGGKTQTTMGFLDKLSAAGYQFCIVDPEGDYDCYDGAVVLGDPQRVPSIEEVLQLLRKPGENAAINLLGVPLADRPAFFATLIPRLQELRAATGRPHWIVIDEAHHLLPSKWAPIPQLLPKQIGGMLLITVHPDKVSQPILEALDVVIGIGQDPGDIIENFARQVDKALPKVSHEPLEAGRAQVWFVDKDKESKTVDMSVSKRDRRRHKKKYAEGELPAHRSFFFTGPEEKLNLRAQNLMLFCQLAEGIDDGTWSYHLKKHDYSSWFKEMIKDDELSQIAYEAESERLTPKESRTKIIEAVNQRYTA
ncbi:MAG: HAD-IIB family hydrolase [Candidatus Obscuribacterales bacterium]|nr:HAD-IIB family hydrolase [Candidatus Obscuribacterales bacterium]